MWNFGTACSCWILKWVPHQSAWMRWQPSPSSSSAGQLPCFLLPCDPAANPGLYVIYFDPHEVENIVVLPEFAEECSGNLLNYLRSSRLSVSNLGPKQRPQVSYWPQHHEAERLCHFLWPTPPCFENDSHCPCVKWQDQQPRLVKDFHRNHDVWQPRVLKEPRGL